MAIVSQQAREQFLEQGYLVVPDVVPVDLRQRVIDAILSYTGVNPDDPTTWKWGNGLDHGIVPLHHDQALWDVRQHPKLYEAFTDVYAQPDLWVSMDRVSYKSPDLDDRRAAVHWDCDPWQFEALAVQGLVYLTDTDADQGAFTCVPSIYRNLREWCTEHEDDPDRRFPRVDESDLVAVPGSAGSLVIFHRLMPHTSGINHSQTHRFVQYVTMQPAGGDDERDQRVKEWQERLPPAWAIRQKIAGQQIPEPGEPPALTELGRKLVGVDHW